MIDKDWEEEDKEFTPKRKVNNKASRTIHIVIGSFYSNKMKRSVEYESLSELIFYFLLELDNSTQRYYVQPVEIPIIYINREGEKKSWLHVPDVLVFRKGFIPTLYQIKGETIKPDDKKIYNISKACEYYSLQKNWNYNIVYPKKLPDVVIRNIKFLNGFAKDRREYSDLIGDLVLKVKLSENVSILELAKEFANRINPLYIIPVIYHLIAKGVFYTDIRVEINQYSSISLNKDQDIFFNEFYLIGA